MRNGFKAAAFGAGFLVAFATVAKAQPQNQQPIQNQGQQMAMPGMMGQMGQRAMMTPEISGRMTQMMDACGQMMSRMGGPQSGQRRPR